MLPPSYRVVPVDSDADAVAHAPGLHDAVVIAVVRREQGLLVQTGDGVREPQNRRVEIVVQ